MVLYFCCVGCWWVCCLGGWIIAGLDFLLGLICVGFDFVGLNYDGVELLRVEFMWWLMCVRF